MMKTFLPFARARALLVFLGVLCAVARSHPSYGSDALKMAFEFDMSPVPRGLLNSDNVASGRLSKRQCDTGHLYCPSTDICCTDIGASCCTKTVCCLKGYACSVSNSGVGSCYAASVITIVYTSTDVITFSTVSTLYSTSTSWVILSSTGYTTVTTNVKAGVSTSTAWVTVTTTKVMKRDAPTTPAPAMTETHNVQAVAPKTSMEPSLFEGQIPIADLLRRALGNVGLLEKRVITSYETFVPTSTHFIYSYYTVLNVVTSTTSTTVQSTVTSTIVAGASTTTTVTSTVTTTVSSSSSVTSSVTPLPASSSPFPTSSSQLPASLSASSSQFPGPPTPVPPSPTNSDTDNGLSQGAKIGIGVSAGLIAVSVFSAIGFCLWRRRRSTAGSGASNWDRTVNQPVPLAGAGAAGAAAEIGSEKIPISPMSSTAAAAVPSPSPTHQAYWAPQQEYELPQQTYPPPQQTYPPPQPKYELPQQTYLPPQPKYQLPQKTNLSPHA